MFESRCVCSVHVHAALYLHHLNLFAGFLWSVEEDFKPVPETWVPALGVKHHSGQPVPDEHGHIPG